MVAILSMEFVLKGDPQSGNLLTLSAVLMVLLQSIPGRLAPGSLGLKPLAAPLSSHAHFGLLWVSMSVLANYSFAYKISVTIFTMVRSCNIIASVILGYLVFGQRFSLQQLSCVGAVSVGVFLASMGEAKTVKSSSSGAACSGCTEAAMHDGEASADMSIWAIGIAMLAFVQLLQGFLGHVQSSFYKRYKDLASRSDLCDEYLFTSHVLALLPLLLLRDDILIAARAAIASDPIALPLPFLLPSRVFWLFVNNVSQTICLKGVFRASATLSPLSLTILLSVRKFLSVVLSIVWFQNPWSTLHSIATVFIFGGAFAYSQAKEPLSISKKDN